MKDLTEKDWIIARLLYAATSTGMVASNSDIIKTLNWFNDTYAVVTKEGNKTTTVSGMTLLHHMYAVIEAEKNTVNTYDTWMKNGVRG